MANNKVSQRVESEIYYCLFNHDPLHPQPDPGPTLHEYFDKKNLSKLKQFVTHNGTARRRTRSFPTLSKYEENILKSVQVSRQDQLDHPLGIKR